MTTIELDKLNVVTGGSYTNALLRTEMQTLNSTIRAQQNHWGSSNQLAMAIAFGSLLRR